MKKSGLTREEYEAIVVRTLSHFRTKDLKKAVIRFYKQHGTGEDIIFNVALNLLEKRLPEKEFIEFCNRLD